MSPTWVTRVLNNLSRDTRLVIRQHKSYHESWLAGSAGWNRTHAGLLSLQRSIKRLDFIITKNRCGWQSELFYMWQLDTDQVKQTRSKVFHADFLLTGCTSVSWQGSICGSKIKPEGQESQLSAAFLHQGENTFFWVNHCSKTLQASLNVVMIGLRNTWLKVCSNSLSNVNVHLFHFI